VTAAHNGLHVAVDDQSSTRARGSAALPSLSRRDGFWFQGNLHPFQGSAVKFLLDTPNAVLADDAGLGKTVTTLSYIARLESAGELDRRGGSACRVLWLTDYNLVEQTRREIEFFLPTHSVVTGDSPVFRRESDVTRQQWANKYGGLGPDILLLAYEDLVRFVNGITKTTTPALVVIDDANRISDSGGNGTSYRHTAVCRVTEHAARVVALTATPLWSHPMDLYRLLEAVRVAGLWREGPYSRRIVTWRTPNVAGPGRAMREPDTWVEGKAREVGEFLTTCMIQRSARDARVQMPTRDASVRFVPLTDSQRQAYEEAAEQPGREAVVAMAAASHARGYASPMVDMLLEELATRDDQVIVRSDDPAVLDLAEERLWRGASYVRIDGSVKPDLRRDAIGQFRAGGVQILLGTKLVGRGIDLSNCNDLISLDLPWSPSDAYQQEGRMRRLGSPHPTYRHLALLPDTPLTRSKLRMLDRRWSTAMAVHLGTPESRPEWLLERATGE
jgi:SNF2 family DNA or RNA helicase